MSTHGASCVPLATTVQIMIHANAGDPFRFISTASASGTEQASGTIQGALSFAGLPGAASVVSCRGFVQGPAPALATTWTRLRAVYR